MVFFEKKREVIFVFRLLRYMKKYWYLAILAPLFMVIEVGMDMVLTMYMQQMVDNGISIGSMENVIKYGFPINYWCSWWYACECIHEFKLLQIWK